MKISSYLPGIPAIPPRVLKAGPGVERARIGYFFRFLLNNWIPNLAQLIPIFFVEIFLFLDYLYSLSYFPFMVIYNSCQYICLLKMNEKRNVQEETLAVCMKKCSATPDFSIFKFLTLFRWSYILVHINLSVWPMYSQKEYYKFQVFLGEGYL